MDKLVDLINLREHPEEIERKKNKQACITQSS